MLSSGTGVREGQSQKEGEGEGPNSRRRAPVESRADAGCAGGRSRIRRHAARGDAVGVDPAVGQGQVDRGQAGQAGQRAGGWVLRVGIAANEKFTTMHDGDLFCLAGLWETWTAPEQVTEPELPGLELGAEPETLRTFTVITTTPNRLAKRVHDRMPVIIHPDDYDLWLSPESAVAAIVQCRADAGALRHPANEQPTLRGSRVCRPSEFGTFPGKTASPQTVTMKKIILTAGMMLAATINLQAQPAPPPGGAFVHQDLPSHQGAGHRRGRRDFN